MWTGKREGGSEWKRDWKTQGQESLCMSFSRADVQTQIESREAGKNLQFKQMSLGNLSSGET